MPPFLQELPGLAVVAYAALVLFALNYAINVGVEVGRTDKFHDGITILLIATMCSPVVGTYLMVVCAFDPQWGIGVGIAALQASCLFAVINLATFLLSWWMAKGICRGLQYLRS